jgi:ketosteroid isomerase-like protein
MKFIMSLVAVAALSFVTSAFGQEEESPSPTPEEKASATVEDKPAATPEEKTAPSAMEMPSPTAKKSPAPAAGKAASPAASPAKSAAPAAAATSGKKMSVEATLRDMENRWEAAVAAHDASAAGPLVANDFVGVSSKFKFSNKSGLLADLKKNNDTYQSAKNETLKVAMFGPNVAVVTGRAREKGTAKDGKAFDRTYYFTDTWMLRGGKWQCIASQAAEAKK